MANATTSGALSGVAGGAVLGATIGGVYGAVIGGVIGGVAGLFSGASSDAQMDNQAAWATYNAQMGYQTTLSNIAANSMVAQINAALTTSAAARSSNAAKAVAEYNATMIEYTTGYNSALLENEIALTWEAAELDVYHLEQQRARERGALIADMGASGTVIDSGSNTDIIMDQKTQEMLDTFVIRRGADVRVGKISDAVALNDWKGTREAERVMWEGELGSYVTTANAETAAAGILASDTISASANSQSAASALTSGNANVTQALTAYSASNTQNMVSGLFDAASQSVGTYYKNKIPSSVNPSSGAAGTSLAINYDPPQSSSLMEVTT